MTEHFGDGEYPFRLPLKWRFELERVVGTAFAAMHPDAADRGALPLIFKRLMTNAYISHDLEVIRFGLLGAGMNPPDALKLWNTYANATPAVELRALALMICDATLHLPDETAKKAKAAGRKRKTRGSTPPPSTEPLPSSASAPETSTT